MSANTMQQRCKHADESQQAWVSLFDLFSFFVHRMLIAVSTELLEFQTASRVSTIFRRGVPGDTGRSLAGIRTTFRTLQRNNDSNTLSSHILKMLFLLEQ